MGDQNDARLDDLFARLASAKSAREAAPVEVAIWSAWLDLDHPDAAPWLARGMQAMSARRLAEALAAFDRVVELAPDYAEGWNKRATVHYLLGNYPESLHDIEKTLNLEPRHFGALSGRGLVLLELDQLKGALESFQSALKIYPKAAGASHNAEALRREIQKHEI